MSIKNFTNSALLVIIAITISSLIGCTEKTNSPNTKTIIDVTRNYGMIVDSSSATYKRYLHQGESKQKIKLFGKDVEVSLGEVEMNTNGDIMLSSGSFEDQNGELIKGVIVFDVSNLKLNTNSEKGGDLFKVEEFPKSTFEISDISKDSGVYILNGTLSLGGISKDIAPRAMIINSGDKMTVNSSFDINTVDWPLRDEKAKKIIIKDVITVDMDIVLEKVSEKADTTEVPAGQ